MKKVHICIFCIIALLVLSCNNSESSHNNCHPYQPNAIEGKWNLVEAITGFSSFITNYPVGKITWNFNTSNNSVTIINNNTDPNTYDVLETGTYNYSIVNNPSNPEYCNQSITIDTYNLGCLTISNNTLTMSTIEVDGVLVKLIR